MSGPEPEPTQTTPEGAEIPVPKRADVFADLRKVAKAGDEAEGGEEPSDG